MTANAYTQRTDMNVGELPKLKKSKIKEAKVTETVAAVPEVRVVGAEMKTGKLWVTVEGPTVMSVQSLAAKTMAYDERFKHGVGQAGLELAGTPWPCDEAGQPLQPSKVPPTRYRAQFRLTPG